MAKKKGMAFQWLEALKDGKSLLCEDVKVDLNVSLYEQCDAEEQNSVILWVDDMRDPAKYGYPNAVWCKNSHQYVRYLMLVMLDNRTDELVQIHYDNDLGEETAEGYDLFVMMEEALHKGSFKNLKQIYVHSSNPSAVHKFMLAARSFKHHFGIDIIRQQY